MLSNTQYWKAVCDNQTSWTFLASLHLVVPWWSVHPSIRPSKIFLNYERFLHCCPCPTVRDCLAVYPALFSNQLSNHVMIYNLIILSYSLCIVYTVRCIKKDKNFIFKISMLRNYFKNFFSWWILRVGRNEVISTNLRHFGQFD